MKPYFGNAIGRILIWLYGIDFFTNYKDAKIYQVSKLIPDWAIAQSWGKYILVTHTALMHNLFRTLQHEYTHYEQWNKCKFAGIGFFIKYVWYNIKYGYKENPFEKEAYENEMK